MAAEIVIAIQDRGQGNLRLVTAELPCILRRTVLEEPGARLLKSAIMPYTSRLA